MTRTTFESGGARKEAWTEQDITSIFNLDNPNITLHQTHGDYGLTTTAKKPDGTLVATCKKAANGDLVYTDAQDQEIGRHVLTAGHPTPNVTSYVFTPR